MQHLFGRVSRAAESTNAERVVSLGEANSLSIAHQVAVIEQRLRKLESAIQKKLTRGGFQQIGATNHFRNLHGRIIHNDSQLISRNIIPPPNDKISKVSSCHPLL